MVTESSELLQLFRLKSDDEVRAMLADPRRREGVDDELASSLYFLLRFVDVAGFVFCECLSSNLKKDSFERKGPSFFRQISEASPVLRWTH